MQYGETEESFDVVSERHRRQTDQKAEENRVATESSLSRQRATRRKGEIRRDIRRQERAQLGAARSTSERREIKEAADKIIQDAFFDLDTGYEPRKNKTDAESDIEQRGTDQFVAPESTRENAQNSIVLDVVLSDNTAGTLNVVIL